MPLHARTVVSAALLAVVAGVLVVVGTSSAANAAGGRVHGDSRSLVDGCRRAYTYDYRIRVPRDDWSLEISIRNPDGRGVHAAAFLGKEDGTSHPRRRRNVRWRMCRAATRPGVHTIRAKLVYSVPPDTPLGQPEDRVKRFRDRFRLTR